MGDTKLAHKNKNCRQSFIKQLQRMFNINCGTTNKIFGSKLHGFFVNKIFDELENILSFNVENSHSIVH